MRALALVLLVGCAAPATDAPDVTDPTDDDEDGIADELEGQLMTRFGPELRMPPDEIDWTRPANVAWYLPQMKMRFDHAGCPDDGDNLLDVGAITPANMSLQMHHMKASGTGLCRHTDELKSADKKATEFFLEAGNSDAVHPGIPVARQSEWQTYIQVRPSEYPGAAYDLQVWFFYAYNDNIGGANHEADWEHMTISLSDEPEVVSVFYATHDAGHRIDDMSMLQWDDTHVIGYAADGSHATYESAGSHPGPAVDDHAYDGGPVWRTWDNFVNLGQVGKLLGDNEWARYGGRWGEVGELDFTSGPVGPMFNGKWDTRNEY
jgi:hypothetical protein